MKKIRVSIILLTTWLALASFYSNAQSAMIDGDKLIEQLIETRYHFNKQLIKGETGPFPPTVSILRREACTISFKGREYIIQNNRIVNVKGVLLTANALLAINERIGLLDRVQYACSEQSNLAYTSPSRDLEYVKTLDRHFFTDLNTIKSFTATIDSKARKPQASILIEMSLAKMELPKEWLEEDQTAAGK
jgi:hypothetical protein